MLLECAAQGDHDVFYSYASLKSGLSTGRRIVSPNIIGFISFSRLNTKQLRTTYAVTLLSSMMGMLRVMKEDF